ncbi:MAG: hypothetical protein P8184_07095 [Calditrichia bacterium]
MKERYETNDVAGCPEKRDSRKTDRQRATTMNMGERRNFSVRLFETGYSTATDPARAYPEESGASPA